MVTIPTRVVKMTLFYHALPTLVLICHAVKKSTHAVSIVVPSRMHMAPDKGMFGAFLKASQA